MGSDKRCRSGQGRHRRVSRDYVVCEPLSSASSELLC
jgi:hypothetical protein